MRPASPGRGDRHQGIQLLTQLGDFLASQPLLRILTALGAAGLLLPLRRLFRLTLSNVQLFLLAFPQQLAHLFRIQQARQPQVVGLLARTGHGGGPIGGTVVDQRVQFGLGA